MRDKEGHFIARKGQFVRKMEQLLMRVSHERASKYMKQ